MADYKVVDAEQLDADLGAVANAIRERAGTTDPLTFPEGMVAGVEGIPDLMEVRLDDKLTEYRNSTRTQIGLYGLAGCELLTEMDCPEITLLRTYAMSDCKRLNKLYLPKVVTIGGDAISDCTNLKIAVLGNVHDFYRKVFGSCNNLLAVVLPRETGIATARYKDLFENTPIINGAGYIYVPSTLLDGYKAATNWSYYADQFRAIEDYPEIVAAAAGDFALWEAANP